jgi:hypothetical protein
MILYPSVLYSGYFEKNHQEATPGGCIAKGRNRDIHTLINTGIFKTG